MRKAHHLILAYSWAGFFAMLQANHYALESAGLQTMVNIRQRDLDYMNTRLNVMSTQAALFAGFVTGTFAANTLIGVANKWTIGLLYYSTAVSLVALVHCLVATTWLMMWGPGLALHGTEGSVQRAWVQMESESQQIVFSFTVGVIAFWVQCVSFYYGYDGTPIPPPLGANITDDDDLITYKAVTYGTAATGATIINLIGSIYTVYCLLRLRHRLQLDDEKDLDEVAATVQHTRNVQEGMDRNRVGDLQKHEDWSKAQQADATIDGSKRQLQQLHGKLDMTSWMHKKRAKFVGFDKWDRRFFVLQGVTLRYYQTEEDAQAHSTFLAEQRRAKAAKRKELGDVMSTLGGTLGDTLSTWGRTLGGSKNSTAPEVPYDGDAGTLVDLKGYEVMLNPSDPNFGFQIQPITRKERKSRTWFLRPADAVERDAWVEVLLAATLHANGSSASSQ